MVKKIGFLLFIASKLNAGQLEELPNSSLQDFPIGCASVEKPDTFILQECMHASAQMLAHITALALSSEDPRLLNTHLIAIAQILSHCLQSIGNHHGFKYGLFSKLASFYQTKKANNAMAEIDLIIKQTHPAADDKVAQFVLHSFADIMHNFATIVGNPHNPDVVAHHVSRILTGIVHIAKEAITKKSYAIPIEAEQQFHEIVLAQACALNLY